MFINGCNTFVAENSKVRSLQEPRRGVRAEGAQALLPLEGLRLRQVHAHRRAAARHGGPGNVSPAASSQLPAASCQLPPPHHEPLFKLKNFKILIELPTTTGAHVLCVISSQTQNTMELN